MTSVQNHQPQLSGNKIWIIAIFLFVSLHSCSVFKRKTVPPPPPAIPETPTEEIPDDKESEVVVVPKDTIKVPDKPNIIIPEYDEINLAVILPFQLEKMDAGENFPSAAKNSLEIYKGIQFALDEANFSDKKLNVYVIDNAGNDTNTKNILSQAPFPNIDIVIGPLYGKSIRAVDSYAKEHGIPFISPLSSSNSLANGNAYIYSANATQPTRYDIMLDYIKTNFINPNIGIIYQPIKGEEDSKNDILDQAKKKGISITEVKSQGSDMFTVATNLLEKGRENVIIVPADDNEEGTIYFDRLLSYLNKLNNYDITVFGLKEWNDVTVVSPEKYPSLKIYVLDRYLDKTNSPKSSVFSNLESRNRGYQLHIYCLQGYDIMSYLVDLMQEHGVNFAKYLSNEEYQGVQTKFKFGEFKPNGYTQFFDNKNINILNYQNGKWNLVN